MIAHLDFTARVSEPRADRGPQAGSPLGVVDATGSSDSGLAISDFGLEDSASPALNPQSEIWNPQSDDPVATARGSDTSLFHLRAEIPRIPKRILNCSGATTVRRVRGFAHRDCSLSFHRACIPGVAIIDINHEMHRPRLPCPVCFAHLNNRVANSDFRVMNYPFGRLMPRNLFRVVCLLQEGDHLWRAAWTEVRHQVGEAFRNVGRPYGGLEISSVAAHHLVPSDASTQ